MAALIESAENSSAMQLADACLEEDDFEEVEAANFNQPPDEVDYNPAGILRNSGQAIAYTDTTTAATPGTPWTTTSSAHSPTSKQV